MPFLSYCLNLIKMQIPSDMAEKSSCFSVSLATIGVCVFCASASVGAFFIKERNGGNEIWNGKNG